MNYTRSFYYDYLPFYHTGVRANFKMNGKLAVNYWIVMELSSLSRRTRSRMSCSGMCIRRLQRSHGQ